MIPNNTRTEWFKTNIDFTSGGDTFRVALFKASTEYSPDPANHTFVSDVFDGGTTGEEMDDTNYSRQTLSNQSVNQNDTDDRAEFDGDNVTFPSLGGTQDIEAVMVHRQVGGDDTTPGDDEIIYIGDDSEESDLQFTTNGNDVIISWPTSGIVRIA